MLHTALRSAVLRVWLAAAVGLSPSASLVAQEGGQRLPAASSLDVRYATPRAFVGLIARPRQVLTAPAMQMLPYEVLQAAGKQEFGIDPLEIEELQVFVEPPAFGPPQAIAVLRFAAPFDLGQLNERLTARTQEEMLDGRRYLRSAGLEPSFFAPDERTLLIGTDEMLQRAVAGRERLAASPLVNRLTRLDAGQDLLGAAELAPIRPVVTAQLQQLPPLPVAYEGFRNLPNLVEAVEWSVRLTSGAGFGLSVDATDEPAAEELEALVVQGLEAWQQQMLAAFEAAEQSEDAIEQAMARYMKRVSGNMLDIYRPERDGQRLVFFGGHDAERDERSEQMIQMATTGILVALLLPAVQAAREAARRNTCRNNLRTLGIAFHNHHDVHKRFPAQANYDADGRPLLSWRVHILPYVGEQALYEQFHLNEPWDSEHNKTLIPLMPQFFADPSSPRSAAEHRSSYVAPVGEGLFMEGQRGITIGDIRDGTARTIMLVEADEEHMPIWTQPQDIEVDRNDPAAGLGGRHPRIFIAVFADVHAEEIMEDTDAARLWALFTRSGGERIGR